VPACIFIGDSIAVGLAQAINRGGLVCDRAARVGVGSAKVVAAALGAADYPIAIVSAGSNNPRDPRLERDLNAIRQVLWRSRVIWVLPYHRGAAYAVTRVAFAFNDAVVDLARYPSDDGVHPRDYKVVAGAIR
jgi:hypothetical protein